MRNKILLLATSAALLAVGAAQAATVQSNFNVTAVVGENCLVSASDLNFGPYLGVAAANVDSTVTVSCTLGTDFTVHLSEGSSGSYVTREMTSGTDSLEYNLYTSADRDVVFGDGTGITGEYDGIGAGLAAVNAIDVLVYGRLFDSDANKNAPAGNYSDNIVVTVTY